MRVAKVLQTLLRESRASWWSRLRSAAKGSCSTCGHAVRSRRCSGCDKRAPGYDQREARQWRHLNVGATRIWLRYAPRRVQCARCGVVNEQVPWGSAAGWFSATFEETTAYLARVADKTSVTKIMGIAWVTVGKIVERIVGERLDSSRLDGLCFIGIDEFSYRKRHHYITVIVDHVTGRSRMGSERKKRRDAGGVLPGARPRAGSEDRGRHARHGRGLHQGRPGSMLPRPRSSSDQFHVQRLASDAVDAVRRGVVRDEDDPERRRAIKSSCFALLRSEWNLTVEDRAKISEIQLIESLALSSLSPQGGSRSLARLPAGRTRQEGSSGMAQLGEPLSAPSLPSRRTHNPEVPRRHPRLHRFQADKRSSRGDQQPDAHCRSSCIRFSQCRSPHSNGLSLLLKGRTHPGSPGLC